MEQIYNEKLKCLKGNSIFYLIFFERQIRKPVARLLKKKLFPTFALSRMSASKEFEASFVIFLVSQCTKYFVLVTDLNYRPLQHLTAAMLLMQFGTVLY